MDMDKNMNRNADKNTNKNVNKDAQKGMNRTEFAQEYSLDTGKTNKNANTPAITLLAGESILI